MTAERNNIVTPIRLIGGEIGFVVRDRIKPSKHGLKFDKYGEPTQLGLVRMFNTGEWSEQSETADADLLMSTLKKLKQIEV